MRKWLAIGISLFPLALGLVAGIRLSKESLAVVIGVLFGLLSSLPLYLVTFFVLKREVRKEEPKVNPYLYPPVIVVNPGEARYLPQVPIELGPEPKPIVRILGEESLD